MPASSFATLLQALAIASGGAAFVLTLLAWEAFRRSPFGNLLGFLAVLLAMFTGMTTLSLLFPEGTMVLELAEAVTYSWLVVFVVMLVRLHDRLARVPRRSHRE